jgi:predicted transcriptional regulator YheO
MIDFIINKIMANTVITLKDKQTLESIKPIVDGIAKLFGECCEVLLHSFESLDRSIIHIANGHITGRSVGAPITDLGMKILQDAADPTGARSKKTSVKNVTDCYYSKTADGKILRSITILINNAAQKPIGMLCINFNMSASLSSLLQAFETEKQQEQKTPENFVTNIDDLIKTTLRDTIAAINNHNNIPNHAKNKMIVCELIKKGLFDIRGAIDIAARELSVSRYTIYNYIRENKFSEKLAEKELI